MSQPPRLLLKRQRSSEDEIKVPPTREAATVLVRSLAAKFGSGILRTDDVEESEKVTYKGIAPLVGLEPVKQLRDIQTFEIRRSRIPTELFKAIVIDLDAMLMQYGPAPEHRTEQARSRLFSPVFNHLVKQFAFTFRNNPEVMIDGRIATGGCNEYYFQAFGTVAILIIEVKFVIGNITERLKAIAQVIAKCDGCDHENQRSGHVVPIHCILSDGFTYECFKFERVPGSRPIFLRGCFPGDPSGFKWGLWVPDFHLQRSAQDFLYRLRFACETVFDVMLSAYIAGLDSYLKQSAERSKTTSGAKSPSLDEWDRAFRLASQAQESFREANKLRGVGQIGEADDTSRGALGDLQESTGAIPDNDRESLIMASWDDDEISRA